MTLPSWGFANAKSLVGASPADAWPLFRGDAQSSGVAGSDLPANPTVVWKRTIKNGVFGATATIVDGTVYLGGLDGPFYCLDLASGEEKWRFPTELGFNAAAAVRDGMVYVGDTEGKFHALDAASGKELWSFTTGAEISAGANFFRDQILVGSQDGSLYCLDSAGKEVWKYTIDNMIQCAPTVVESRAFLAGCDGLLHLIDLETGQATGTVSISDPTGCTPVAAGDLVYFGTQGAKVLAVNWREEKIAWTYQHPERKAPYQSSAALAQGVLVLGGRDRIVHGINVANGQGLWQFPTKGRIDSSPVVVGDRAYIGGGDGRVYGLNLKTGEKAWEYEAGGAFTASPAVAAGRMVIANDAGLVLCFGGK